MRTFDQGELTVLRHEYASIELDYMVGAGEAAGHIRDPLEEVEVILASVDGQAVTLLALRAATTEDFQPARGFHA